MSVFDAVKAAVEAAADLSGSVFHVEALKNAAPPFAFWLQTREETEQALDGYTELDTAAFELHICSRYLDQLDAKAAAARTAVISLQGTETEDVLYERINIRQITPVIHEREVGLYRKVYEITINYQSIPIVPIPGTI